MCLIFIVWGMATVWMPVIKIDSMLTSVGKWENFKYCKRRVVV